MQHPLYGEAIWPAELRFRRAIPGRFDPAVAERVATRMIRRHGADAAREAVDRLNRMIDRENRPGRDLWACVVHVIHERLGRAIGSGEERAAG